MLVVELLIFIAALAAVGLLALQQVVTQIREYQFYKANGWNFSIDSGLNKIDERIAPYRVPLTHWQRFYLFRPYYILSLIAFMGLMIAISS